MPPHTPTHYLPHQNTLHLPLKLPQQEVVHLGHQLDNARDRPTAEGGLLSPPPIPRGTASDTPQPNTPPPISAAAQSPATPATESLPVQRPERVRLPNVRLNPEEWELGQIEDSTQVGTIVDLLLELVRRLPVDQRGEARGGRR